MFNDAEASEGGTAVTPTAPATTQSNVALTIVPQTVKPTRITRLTMEGFKSFAKFTELLFCETFSVIMGPNGSGKSNIGDALIFVLGKSSSKQLRAERAANLIYNGGKTKQPGNQAEVSIFFDNSERAFPLADEEVKISRMVRKDGTSKYRINGKTVTRQEMLELLRSAKIDPDGYNIIMQGDITRLIEMNPVDRRQLIEEIAGIGVYEEKKEQALKELGKVEEKIGEAHIVLRERESALRALKKDKEQALKWKDLTDNAKSCKATLLTVRLEKKEKEYGELEGKANEHKSKLDELNAQIEKHKTDLTALREKLQTLTKEIESRVGDTQLQKDIEEATSSVAEAKAKRESLAKELAQGLEELQRLEGKMNELGKKEEEVRRRHENFVAASESRKKQLSELQTKLKKFQEEHGLHAAEEFDQDMEALDKETEQVQQELQGLQEQRQALIREKDKTEFQIEAMDRQMERVRELEQQHKKELDQLKRNRMRFKQVALELNEALNKDAQLAKELGNGKGKLSEMRQELVHAQLKHQAAMEKMASSAAVKAILQNKQKLGEVYGTLAELGDVSSEHAKAFHAALGGRAESLVVEDTNTAVRCIKFLRTNRLGVARFLPLRQLRTRKVPKLPKETQLFVDIVQCEQQFKPAFEAALGATLLAADVKSAQSAKWGSRVVTTQGDVVEPSGALIGGYRRGGAAGKDLRDLSRKAETLKALMEALEEKTAAAEKERDSLDPKITTLRNEKAELEGEIIKVERALHVESTEIESSDTYKDDLRKLIEETDSKLQELEEKVDEKLQALAQVKTKRQELRSKISELRNPSVLAELSAFEAQRGKLNDELVKVEADRATSEETLRMSQEELNEIKSRQNAVKERQAVTEDDQKAMEKELKDNTKKLKELQGEQERARAEHKSLFEQRNKLSDQVSENEGKMYKLEEKSRHQELELNRLSIDQARLDAERGVLKGDFEQYRDVPLVQGKSEDELVQDFASAETELQTIGSVNLKAIELYDLADHEHKVLQEKKAKLVSEKDEVFKLMEEIEGGKAELFLKTLKIIDQHFRQTFGSLTSKGDAYLELENPQAPFEAGLRIKVRLTGDKFIDLRSLSGGEKTLTALAFLFAIQEHEPASFYVFDEVDAALDKNNSELLAKLIRRYSQNAQYIVISHNDAVINEGDVLYGVSMNQQQGRSQVVSLKA